MTVCLAPLSSLLCICDMRMSFLLPLPKKKDPDTSSLYGRYHVSSVLLFLVISSPWRTFLFCVLLLMHSPRRRNAEMALTELCPVLGEGSSTMGMACVRRLGVHSSGSRHSRSCMC